VEGGEVEGGAVEGGAVEGGAGKRRGRGRAPSDLNPAPGRRAALSAAHAGLAALAAAGEHLARVSAGRAAPAGARRAALADAAGHAKHAARVAHARHAHAASIEEGDDRGGAWIGLGSGSGLGLRSGSGSGSESGSGSDDGGGGGLSVRTARPTRAAGRRRRGCSGRGHRVSGGAARRGARSRSAPRGRPLPRARRRPRGRRRPPPSATPRLHGPGCSPPLGWGRRRRRRSLSKAAGRGRVSSRPAAPGFEACAAHRMGTAEAARARCWRPSRARGVPARRAARCACARCRWAAPSRPVAARRPAAGRPRPARRTVRRARPRPRCDTCLWTPDMARGEIQRKTSLSGTAARDMQACSRAAALLLSSRQHGVRKTRSERA